MKSSRSFWFHKTSVNEQFVAWLSTSIVHNYFAFPADEIDLHHFDGIMCDFECEDFFLNMRNEILPNISSGCINYKQSTSANLASNEHVSGTAEQTKSLFVTFHSGAARN
jgi:hypothetical protein